jgi:hypothetical protein
MATTDRIFKEFLHRFFPEFMRLFFPDEAAYLDFSTATWVEQELISNFPDQKLRISDVVVEVKTVIGEEQVVLVHIEVEGSRKQSLPSRMFEYYSLFRTLRQKPVLPLACVLIPDAGGLQWQTYRETLFGHTLIEFHYGQVGLSDLDSSPYLDSGDPVAAALATLMKPGDRQPAELKLAAMRTVTGSVLTEGNKLFLIQVMETYLPTASLTGAGEMVMQELMEVQTTWVEKAIERGRVEGRVEGRIEGQHEVLLHLLEVKFGTLPDTFVERFEAITDSDALDALSEQLLIAKSLTEIHLPDKADNL